MLGSTAGGPTVAHAQDWNGPGGSPPSADTRPVMDRSRRGSNAECGSGPGAAQRSFETGIGPIRLAGRRHGLGPAGERAAASSAGSQSVGLVSRPSA